jgi:hypothetical protein
MEQQEVQLSSEDWALLTNFTGSIMPNPITWNDLMPVVGKIGKMESVREVSVSTIRTRLWFNPNQKVSYLTSPITQGASIDKTFMVVRDFIRWHNQQTTNV